MSGEFPAYCRKIASVITQKALEHVLDAVKKQTNARISGSDVRQALSTLKPHELFNNAIVAK